jgi:glutathione S-transferase
MTNAALVLYDFPAETGLTNWASFSPFVLTVQRALVLAKLPYRIDKLPMLRIKKYNPTGQLPVLMIDSEAVADSTMIMHRIERLAPGSLTAGLDPRAVAEAWLWEEFADTALYPQVLVTRWVDERGWPTPRRAFFAGMPPLVRDVIASMVRRKMKENLANRDFTRAGLAACETRLFRVLDHLDARAPERGFWLGDSPTVADIGLFGQLHALRLPLTAFRASEIAARTRLSAWLDRVDAVTQAAAG